MAQHDYVIANGTGAAVRSDLNNALAAIVSQNSGATEPATMYAYQWWADTSTGLLKLRNAANNAWITLRELDGTLTIEAGTVSAPGLAFASDLNTGVWSPGADQFAIATNGVERVEWGTSEVVFNDGGANYDFRIEGDTNSSLFFVDASAEAVGIGSTAPQEILEVRKDSAGASVVGALLTNASSNANTAIGISFSPNTSGTTRSASIYGVNETASQNATALTFFTNANGASGTEKARLDSSGRFLVGTSSSRSIGGATPQLQVEGTSNSTSSLTLIQNANTDAGAYIFLGKSRGTSSGSVTAVSSGDALGGIYFNGANGSNLSNFGASIEGVVDGTVSGGGTNDMPGRLVFSTTADGASSPTERMRITQDGDVFINHNSSTSPVVGGEKLGVLGVGNIAIAASTTTNTTPTLFLANGSDTNNAYVARFSTGSGGNTRGEIYYNGSQLVYATSSDYRLKENVVSFDAGIEIVKQLRPVKYNWIENGNEDIGFIAHEVQTVFPNAVGGEKDAVDDNGKILPQTYDPSKLVPLLTAALQEAVAKIETLEARLTAAGID